MTVERVVAIALPLDEERRRLVEDIESARARAIDAEPGDRMDIVRYENLSSQLESWAFREIGKPGVIDLAVESLPESTPTLAMGDAAPPDWAPSGSHEPIREILSGGGAMVLVRLSLEAGATNSASDNHPTPPPPAKRWKAKKGEYGSRAVRARFEDQLSRAVESSADSHREPIIPSGIQNKVLTESLRAYVDGGKDANPVLVPVEYRDGSRAANAFALRSLQLLTEPPTADHSFSFALLSIRHTELDAIVDGAWLRNVQISQPRTQAETDDLVYSLSLEQLDALTAGGSSSVELRMYQTGLEPAIVGFYRAVTDHLLEHPGTLVVLPMYFQQPRPPQQDRPHGNGEQRKRNRGRGSRPAKRQVRPNTETIRVSPEDATYGAGLPWATSGRQP